MSRLDFQQIIQKVYNETLNRLRVDATVSIDELIVDVELDAADDSVRIGNGSGDFLSINTDGSINVILKDSPNIQEVSYYNEITSVPSSTLTTIITYTATVNGKLNQVSVFGNNVAMYQVEVNSQIIDKCYTYFGGPLGNIFDFKNGVAFDIGDIITVKVLHNRPYLGNFNSRIQVTEQI